ncbi:MAG TPA: methyltransferase domain-containing protein, partial [Fimbriimonadaceae bacterium]|nr:methyltransferase domain-containing protein [Fimbriimonadaceae bacterium]
MDELAPLARFLDPRPALEAAAQPIADSVSIPVEELARRMHELPPRHGRGVVAGPEPWATQGVESLRASGREAVLAESWRFGGDGRGRLWRPNDFLAEIAEGLPWGEALDLACGTGRDAVYLASLGWKVTAIDHLPDALERGQDLARRYLRPESAGRIRWICQDLEKEPVRGEFDLVSIFWYLDRRVMRSIPDCLRRGGSLVLE